MPSGYTDPIKNDITFEQFALGCARNFGALVTMRDEPADAPIPAEFTPSAYSVENLQKAEARVKELMALTDEEKRQRAILNRDESLARVIARRAERKDLRGKYETMLAQAVAWNPPTPSHTGLRDFMIGQIRQSIEWDCDCSYLVDPPGIDGAQWFKNEIAEAARNLINAQKSYDDEVRRGLKRTEWVNVLRGSLK